MLGLFVCATALEMIVIMMCADQADQTVHCFKCAQSAKPVASSFNPPGDSDMTEKVCSSSLLWGSRSRVHFDS